MLLKGTEKCMNTNHFLFNFNFTLIFCILFKFNFMKFYLFYFRYAFGDLPIFFLDASRIEFPLDFDIGDKFYILLPRLRLMIIFFGVCLSVIYWFYENITSNLFVWNYEDSSTVVKLGQPKYLKGSKSFLVVNIYCFLSMSSN